MCAPTRPPRPRTRAPRRPAARGANAPSRTARGPGRPAEAGGHGQVAGGAIRAYSNPRREMIPQSRAGSRQLPHGRSRRPCAVPARSVQRPDWLCLANRKHDGRVLRDKNVLALRSHSPFRSFRDHRPPCDPYAETADATMAIMLAYCSQHLGLHRCVHSCVGSLRHAKPIPSRYACRLSGSSPRAFALRCASHQRAKSEVSPSTLATSVWPCSS